MIIESPTTSDILGSVKIYGLQRVLVLESRECESPMLQCVLGDEIEDILERMAVILPVKDEKLNLLDGVLRAIPYNCTIIVVSNSNREKRDVFRMEEDIVKNFYKLTRRSVTLVHQKDPGLALALKEAGYDDILDEGEVVRDGKAEGMIIGLLIAKYLGKDYVGFIDADNYFPCAVNEYVRDYAAGFRMSNSPYAMVRLHWKHKPKIVKRKLYFKKWGRVSQITNKYINQLLSSKSGFETEIVSTGNAGEHAMTMELATIMDYSTGYSIEPYQLIYLLEEFGRDETKYKDAASAGIEIYQIETLNPHLHEEKGEVHVKGMIMGSLSAIYHSKMMTRELRTKILQELKALEVIESEEDIKKNLFLPSIEKVDVSKFFKILSENSQSMVSYLN